MKKPKILQEKNMTRKPPPQLIEEISKAEKIISAIGDGISIIDRTFEILYQNQTERDMMGNHVGEKCYKAYAERLGICGGCPVALTFKDGIVHRVQKEIQTNEGTRYVEINASPLKNSEGNIIAGIVVVRDITERTNAEEALRRSEERYKAILEDQTELICRFTPDTILTFVNEAYCNYFGRKRDQLIGFSFLPLIPEENRNSVHSNIISSLNRENPVMTHEHPVLMANGEIGWQQWTNRAIYDKQGNLIEYQSVGRDITDRKETEIALQQREGELQDKTQNLEEVNTALKVLLQKRQEENMQVEEKVMINIRELVKPYLMKLKNGGLNSSQKTYVDIIDSNLDEIISSFTVRLSSGHLRLTPTEIKVANLVKQGKTNKDIAAMLHVSSRTAAFHRERIREKLGLKNKKTNLRSYLLSIN